MSDEENAKKFFEGIEKRFAKNEKAVTKTLFVNFFSMKYAGKGNLIEYIIEMSKILQN